MHQRFVDAPAVRLRNVIENDVRSRAVARANRVSGENGGQHRKETDESVELRKEHPRRRRREQHRSGTAALFRKSLRQQTAQAVADQDGRRIERVEHVP